MCVLDFHRPKTRDRLIRGESVHWVESHKTRGRYIRAACLSFPKWVKRADLAHLKELRAALTASTGIPHVIDHVIPLNHPMVCGLSVPENLQVITYRQNGAKSNYWNPDQLDLFK
jgi:5-methylcytosine-specific restriction endonuclease McrA